MKKEQCDQSSSLVVDSLYETDVSHETGGIGGRHYKRQYASQPQQQQPPKRAKKSLESSWEPCELPFAIETPVSDLLKWWTRFRRSY